MGIVTDLLRSQTIKVVQKELEDLEVDLHDYQDSMEALAKHNPKGAEKLQKVLHGLGLLDSPGGPLNKRALDQYDKVVQEVNFKEKRLYDGWFGKVGKVVGQLNEHFKIGFAAGFTYDRFVHLHEVAQDGMTAQLQTTGKANMSVWGYLTESKPFLDLHSAMSAEALKYGFEEGEVTRLMGRYIQTFGTDRKKAERAFSSMLAFARTSGMDVHEVFEELEERGNLLDMNIEQAGDEFLDSMVLDSQKANENLEETTKTLTGYSTKGAVWPKEFLTTVWEMRKDGGRTLSQNMRLVSELTAESYKTARKYAISMKQMQGLAKGYVRLISGPSYTEWFTARNVFQTVEKEIKERTEGLTEAEAENVTRDILQEYVGQHQIGQAMEAWKLMRQGDTYLAPQVLSQLMRQSRRGLSALAHSHVEHLKTLGMKASVAQMMDAGMERTEALHFALGLKAGEAENILTKFMDAEEKESGSAHEMKMKEEAREQVRSSAKGIVGNLVEPIAYVLKHPLTEIGVGLGALAALTLKEKFLLTAISQGWLTSAINYTRAAGVPSGASGLSGLSGGGKWSGLFRNAATGRMRWGRILGTAAVAAATVGTGYALYKGLSGKNEKGTSDKLDREASTLITGEEKSEMEHKKETDAEARRKEAEQRRQKSGVNNEMRQVAAEMGRPEQESVKERTSSPQEKTEAGKDVVKAETTQEMEKAAVETAKDPEEKKQIQKAVSDLRPTSQQMEKSEETEKPEVPHYPPLTESDFSQPFFKAAGGRTPATSRLYQYVAQRKEHSAEGVETALNGVFPATTPATENAAANMSQDRAEKQATALEEKTQIDQLRGMGLRDEDIDWLMQDDGPKKIRIRKFAGQAAAHTSK